MLERAYFSQVLLAAVLLTHAAASAEDAFSAQWRQFQAHQASGAKLVISAAKTTFFLGETPTNSDFACRFQKFRRAALFTAATPIITPILARADVLRLAFREK